MKKLAVKVMPSGELTKIDLGEGDELSILQNAVDGLIQPIDFFGFTMWVNEEGLLRNDLTPNFAVRAFYSTPIMGNVIFTGAVDDEGDTLPLSEDVVKLIEAVCSSFRELVS